MFWNGPLPDGLDIGLNPFIPNTGTMEAMEMSGGIPSLMVDHLVHQATSMILRGAIYRHQSNGRNWFSTGRSFNTPTI